MIGNKFREDIVGALNAGMSAILVNSQLSESDKDYLEEKGIEIEVLNHIGELKDIL
jgi:putative hydrolase of the HAD superfamily